MNKTTVGELYKNATYIGSFDEGVFVYFFDSDKNELGYCHSQDRCNYSAEAYLASRKWDFKIIEPVFSFTTIK